MADDYIFVSSPKVDKTTSNPAKDSEEADSDYPDGGRSSAKQTVGGAAKSGGVDSDRKISAKTRKNNRDLLLLIKEILPLMFCITILILIFAFLSKIIMQEENAKGPRFQIHSISSTPFNICFNSIVSDWNMSLGVENLNSMKKFSYDFMQVSILYGETHLATTMVTPFLQVPYDQLLLNVYVLPFRVYLSSCISNEIKNSKRRTSSLSINVLIHAKISTDGIKSSKRLIVSCTNIVLQFFPGDKKAEMVAKEPVPCV